MSGGLSLAERTALAEKLRRGRQRVAESVTDEFLARHPEWLVRYGERARTFGIEDACFHVDFLSAAIEAGSALAFEDYARWTARMLGSRGIAAASLAENLEQVGRAFARSLDGRALDLVGAFVEAGMAAALAPDAPAPGSREGLAELRQVLLQALLLGRRQAAATVVLEALRGGVPLMDLYVQVIQAVLYEVGHLWETNRITVAQEHMATALVEYVLTLLYDRLERAPVARGRAVIMGVTGELHNVGAHIVSDVLEADGWDVRYLGTNVPTPGVVAVVREHKAAVLGVSATMLFSLPGVRQLVTDVTRELGGERPRLVVGGSAFRLAPELPRELGADAVALDLSSAVAAFRAFATP